MKRNIPVTQVEVDYSPHERLISETDLRGIITRVNSSFCKVSGYTEEELIGKPHNIVRHPDVPREMFADLWRTIQAGERWVGVVKNRAKNGDHYWVKAVVSPIVQGGKVVGYRSVRRKPSREEITEAEELYRRIRAGEVKIDTLEAIRRKASRGERMSIAEHLGIMIGWPAVIAVALAGAGTARVSPYWLWIIAVVGGAVGVGLALLVYNWQTRPVKAFTEVIRAIAEGDLSVRVDLPRNSRLGQTAWAVNMALDGMEVAISDVTQMLEGLRQGEFGRRVVVTLPGELARIKDAANQAAEQIESTIRDLNERLERIAHGELDVQREELRSAGSFKKAQESAIEAATRISEVLRDIIASCQALSEGDLTRRVEVEASGELRELQVHLTTAVSALAESLIRVRGAAESAANAASEIAQAVEEIARGAEKQMLTVEEVVGSLSASEQSITGISERTEAVLAGSQATVEVVAQAQERLAKLVESVEQIAARGKQINAISGIIEGIAKRTKLLSLNAAIEAARAGEYGRGFSVVADEVGKLAVNVEKSAREITEHIKETVSDIERTVQFMKDVSEEMTRIETQTQEINRLLSDISEAMQQQRDILAQIGRHALALRDIAQSNAAATEELTASTSEMANLANVTHKEIQKFRLPL